VKCQEPGCNLQTHDDQVMHRSGKGETVRYWGGGFCPPLVPGEDDTCTHVPACPDRGSR
jgi:hypothetical protein